MKNCLLAACIGVVLSGMAGCGPTAQPPEAKVSGPRDVAAPPANVERKPGYAERLAAFKEAVQKGRLSEVRELLKNGQDVNDRDDNGQTPLIWAASKGNMAIFWLLLAQGALATERDAQGRNALMHAADGKQTEVVQALVAPNQALQAAGAALKLAGVEGKLGFQGIGKSLDERDNKGQTALMLACRAGGKDAVQLLFDATGDIDLRDSEGQTALMLAAAAGHRDIVNLLLQRFYNLPRYANRLEAILNTVRSQDRQGKTAAELARLGGHKELAEYLDDYSRDPLALDEKGQNALHRAVDKGDRNKLDELLRRGADPFIADAQGRTAPVLAAIKGDVQALGLIIALYPRRKDTVEYFNLADKQELTALMHAAVQGHAHCVQALLGDGSPPAFGGIIGFDVYVVALTEAADKEGHNALMLAAAKGHTQVVRSLLQAFGENNIDLQGLPGPGKRLDYLRATDKAGKTALQIAQDAGHVTVVKVLKEFGAQ